MKYVIKYPFRLHGNEDYFHTHPVVKAEMIGLSLRLTGIVWFFSTPSGESISADLEYNEAYRLNPDTSAIPCGRWYRLHVKQPGIEVLGELEAMGLPGF